MQWKCRAKRESKETPTHLGSLTRAADVSG